MELAIPFVALGGMYIILNDKEKDKEKEVKEGFNSFNHFPTQTSLHKITPFSIKKNLSTPINPLLVPLPPQIFISTKMHMNKENDSGFPLTTISLKFTPSLETKSTPMISNIITWFPLPAANRVAMSIK